MNPTILVAIGAAYLFLKGKAVTPVASSAPIPLPTALAAAAAAAQKAAQTGSGGSSGGGGTSGGGGAAPAGAQLPNPISQWLQMALNPKSPINQAVTVPTPSQGVISSAPIPAYDFPSSLTNSGTQTMDFISAEVAASQADALNWTTDTPSTGELTPTPIDQYQTPTMSYDQLYPSDPAPLETIDTPSSGDILGTWVDSYSFPSDPGFNYGDSYTWTDPSASDSSGVSSDYASTDWGGY